MCSFVGDMSMSILHFFKPKDKLRDRELPYLSKELMAKISEFFLHSTLHLDRTVLFSNTTCKFLNYFPNYEDKVF